jgi:hypothetical protein
MPTHTLHLVIFTCRKATTWDRRLYFPSEGRRAEDVFTLKIKTASAGCEPVNLGTKGQHATSRPPKPLKQVLTALKCNYENIKILQYIRFVNISSQLLYAFFWVIPRCPKFICQRFGTLWSIFIGLWRWNRQSVPIRWHIKFVRQELPRRKHTTLRTQQKFQIKNKLTMLWHKNYLVVRFFKYKLAAFSLCLEHVHKRLPQRNPKGSHPDSVWSVLRWATAM